MSSKILKKKNNYLKHFQNKNEENPKLSDSEIPPSFTI